MTCKDCQTPDRPIFTAGCEGCRQRMLAALQKKNVESAVIQKAKGNIMKVWTSTEFEGHYPVGVAAVVVADTAMQAAELLNKKLVEHGLKATAKAEEFKQLSTTRPIAVVLNDGDY